MAIDGANVALALGKNEGRGSRVVANLPAVLQLQNDLHELGCVTYVLFDYSMVNNQRQSRNNRQLLVEHIDGGSWHVTQAGEKADLKLLEWASKRSGYVISNDAFLKESLPDGTWTPTGYDQRFPWILDGVRRVGFERDIFDHEWHLLAPTEESAQATDIPSPEDDPEGFMEYIWGDSSEDELPLETLKRRYQEAIYQLMFEGFQPEPHHDLQVLLNAANARVVDGHVCRLLEDEAWDDADSEAISDFDEDTSDGEPESTEYHGAWREPNDPMFDSGAWASPKDSYINHRVSLDTTFCGKQVGRNWLNGVGSGPGRLIRVCERCLSSDD